MSGKMAKTHLCVICGCNEPTQFYANTTKSRCKKCISIKAKESRETVKEDIEMVTMEIIDELRDRIETLDEQEVFNNADGRKTFRETLNDKMLGYDDDIRQLKKDLIMIMDSLIVEKDRSKTLEKKLLSCEQELNDGKKRYNELNERMKLYEVDMNENIKWGDGITQHINDLYSIIRK